MIVPPNKKGSGELLRHNTVVVRYVQVAEDLNQADSLGDNKRSSYLTGRGKYDPKIQPFHKEERTTPVWRGGG